LQLIAERGAVRASYVEGIWYQKTIRHQAAMIDKLASTTGAGVRHHSSDQKTVRTGALCRLAQQSRVSGVFWDVVCSIFEIMEICGP
jgi:hypothetical protein